MKVKKQKIKTKTFEFKSINKIWINLLEYLPGKYGLTTERFFRKRSQALKQIGEYKGQVLCFKNEEGVVRQFYQWNGIKWENVTKKQIIFPPKKFTRRK